MPKTKIIYVITQGELGGAQRYVHDLATNLDKTQYDVLVMAGAEKPDLKIKLERAGIPCALVKNLVRKLHPLKDLLAIFELQKAFRELEPNIIHLNSGKAGFLGSIAAGLAGQRNKVIFTAHGFSFLEPNPWWLRTLYLWAEKIAKPFRQKIICVSEYDRQQALKQKIGAEKQLITIHNGIDTEKFQILRGQLQINSKFKIPNTKLVSTIAHLYPTKGLKYLIEAAKIVTAKFPAVSFVVIGEGQEKTKLESRIKNYGLGEKFFLLGAIPNASQYLTEFDIFVLPSIKEGFPYTILEAMAAGLPIVATNVGGIPEMITPSLSPPIPLRGTGGEEVGVGILVPPKNPETLAEVIIYLLNHPDLAEKLIQNAREKVGHFTVQKMLAETEKVYRLLA